MGHTSHCRTVNFSWIALLGLWGCLDGADSRFAEIQHSTQVTSAELIQFNQEKLRAEQRFIDSLSVVWGWSTDDHFIRTQSGMVGHLDVNRLSGPPFSGDTIEWTGTIMLLDSTVLFEWNDTAPFRFLLDQSAWPTGFNELAHIMGRGDRAQCMLPSHLGWGLTGWPPLVPQEAILLLDVRMDFATKPSELSSNQSSHRLWDQILNELERGTFQPNADWVSRPQLAGSPCIAWYDAERELGEGGFLRGEEVELTMRTLKAISLDSTMELGVQQWEFTVGDNWQLISVLEQVALQNPMQPKWECWCPVAVAFGPLGLPSVGLEVSDVVGFQWEWRNIDSATTD